MPNLVRKYIYYMSSIVNLISGITDPFLVLRVFLKIAPPGIKRIRLRHSGVVFSVRGAMDIWSVKETLLDRFYQRFGTSIGDGWTLVDIGGGIGEFTIFAALGHPSNKVYAFEPFTESFALLQENLRQNGLTNAQALPQAVSDHTGSVTLDISAGEPLKIQSHSGEKAPQSIHVSGISLEDAFTQLKIEACDLLKLDCEGAEYAIILNTPAELLKRIRRIVMEYHDRVSEYHHTDLVTHLRQHGFTVQIQPNYVHNNLGYLYAYQN